MDDTNDHRSLNTEGSGNTKQTPLCLRARSFQLTLNQIEKYEDLKNEFTKLKSMDYFVSCKEIAPSTGHEHIHIYAHFNNPYKLSQKIMSFGAHIEICRGSPKQNIEYIKKDGNILDEIGDPPKQGKWLTVNDLREMEIGECPANLFNIKRKIEEEEAGDFRVKDIRKEVKVYYIWGPSGVGKTNKAFDIIGDEIFNIVKYDNNFWLGCKEGRKIALYDEWRDSHMKPSEFLNFIDYIIHNMNIKGGSIKNNYTTIIITTVQDIDKIYKGVGEEPRKQWLRRITEVIHLE